MSQDPEWYQRLLLETDDMSIKYSRLKTFIHTEQFKMLPENVKHIMISQAMLMSSYIGCLELRVAMGHSFE